MRTRDSSPDHSFCGEGRDLVVARSPARARISAVCSPTAGGADGYRARSPSNDSGSAVSLRSGIVGWSRCWIMPSASVCGAFATSATSATGAAGTPASVSRACQYAVSFVGERLLQDRTELVAMAHPIGVRARSGGRRRARAARRRRRSRRTAGRCRRRSSARRPASRTPGTAPPSGSASPRPCGTVPVGEVPGEVVADVAERRLVERDVDDAIPRRSRSRSSSAASTPSAAQVPVPWSISDEPTRTPGRPGSPVIEIRPPAACISAS